MGIIAAFLINALCNFVVGLLLARFLGPAEYGRFALAVAVGVLVQTIVFDWARLAAVRFYSERARLDRPAVRATLDLGLGLLIVLVLAVTMGLVLSGKALPMSNGLAIMTAGVAVSNGVFDYSTALVRARFRDRLYLVLIGGKNVLSLLLTVGGAFWYGSAVAALAGVVLSMTGSLLLAARELVDRMAPVRQADGQLAGAFVRYGLPIVAANLFYQAIPLADRLLIADRFGLAASGQFSFAYDIGVRIVAAVGSALDVLLFQLAVRLDENQGGAAARRQIGRNVMLVLAVLAPACAGLWQVLPSFEALAVPAEFRGPFARNLTLLLPGLLCYGLIFFAVHPIFQIERRTAPLIAAAFLACGLNLLAVAIMPASLDGFAIAQGAALLAAAGMLVLWARRLAPFEPSRRDMLGVAGGTAMVTAMSWLLGRALAPGLSLLVLQVGASALSYAGLVIAFDVCGLRTAVVAIVRHRDVRLA